MSRAIITVIVPEIEDAEAIKLKEALAKLVAQYKEARVQVSLS